MHKHLKELEKLIVAGIPTIWLQTHEEKRAITLMEGLKAEYEYSVMEWDCVKGARITYDNGLKINEEELEAMKNPRQTVMWFNKLDKKGVIMVLYDFHKFMKGQDVVRAVRHFLNSDAPMKHIIFVSPTANIPDDLEKDILLTHLQLPDATDIENTLNSILKFNQLSDIVKYDKEHIQATQGLTRQECVNAFSLSLATDEELKRKDLEKFKLEAVKKSGMMEIFPAVDESELGGLDLLKKYMKERTTGFDDPDLPTPTGILLMGLPGGGKSLSAKAIASMLKMPLIKLDIASLKSKYVGESESKMGQALNLIDAVSPAVVWLDEIEKSVGGVLSSNRSDGGTSSAMFGKLLTWMQESKTPKFIVATCNDIQPLLEASHGALIRRFDDIFFVDTPTESEKEEILKIHNAKYKAEIDEKMISKMNNWTGAEIEKLCKSSRFEGSDQAFSNIRPIYEQNKELFENMRKWANKNARPANRPAAKKSAKKKDTSADRKLNINV